MAPEARKESNPPKLVAVLPPELEGVDLEHGDSKPVAFDAWDAGVEARLADEWAKHE